MTRYMLMNKGKNDLPNYNHLKKHFSELSLDLHFDSMIRLWEHHFDAFEFWYPNGYKKTGTILYKPEHVRVPIARTLPVFESSEFREGKPPRAIVTIDYAVACTLPEITEDELLRDGFESQEDLLWQMTEMKGRYYDDLTTSKIVSYYSLRDYNPKPNEEEIVEILSKLKISL